MLEALFREERIELPSYPFPLVSIPSGSMLHFDLIRDVDLSKSPPEFRLKSGEILFVSAEQKRELEDFAAKFGIPRVQRYDVWADLLLPFLDTQLPAADQEKALRRLQDQGFSLNEISSIRDLVKKPVLLYNSVVWEWVHLGLYDVLEAVRKNASPQGFQEFYWYAMCIANRTDVLLDADQSRERLGC